MVNGSCVLEVRGLQPNQEYVFAVAALTRGGGVVGRGIGHTGPPLPAAHPFPALTGWSYLCQVGGTVGAEGGVTSCVCVCVSVPIVLVCMGWPGSVP